MKLIKKILLPAIFILIGGVVGHVSTQVKVGFDYRDREIRNSLDESRNIVLKRKLIDSLADGRIKEQLSQLNDGSLVKSVWPLLVLKPSFTEIKEQGGHDDVCTLMVEREVLKHALITGNLEALNSVVDQYFAVIKQEMIDSDDEMNRFYDSCAMLLAKSEL